MNVLAKIAVVVVVFLVAIVAAAAISLLMAFPVKWCWNYAVVSTFAAPTISWGKAWCLMFLSTTLLKATASATATK